MRSFIAILALLAASLGFVACDRSEQPATATRTVTVSASPTEVSTSDQDQQFLYLLEQGNPDFQGTNEASVLQVAHGTCTLLDQNPSESEVEVVLNVISDAGVPAVDAGYLVGAAVSFFCPEHNGLLDQFQAKYGSSNS